MPIVVLAASQVGHLLSAELRQGPRALAPVGTGAHSYVPALTTLALGAAGAAVLAAVLVVAAAQVASASSAAAGRRHRVSVLDLAAALFALQLALFLVQETLEAAAWGTPLPDIGALLLWGCLGQLPVAVLAALAMSWLGSRFEAAVDELAAAAGQPLASRPALTEAHQGPPAHAAPPARRFIGAVSQRGPPRKLLGPA